MVPHAASGLDTLPNEILQQLTTHCSMRSILAVASVNRKFRSIFYDPVLIRNVARLHGLSEVGEKAVQAYCESMQLSDDHDTRALIWARYCEALARASELDYTEVSAWLKSEDETEPRAGFEEFLPQLIVLHSMPHKRQSYNIPPAVLTNEVMRGTGEDGAFRNLGTMSRSHLPKTSAQLSFCFAASALELDVAPSSRKDMRQFITAFAPLRVSSKRKVMDDDRATLYVIVGVIAYTVGPFVDKPDSLNLLLPTLPRLPLRIPASLSKLPLPFQSPQESISFRDWLQAQSHNMTDPTFLKQGKWCGYYTNGFELGRIGPPMRNIQFKLNDSHEANHSRREDTDHDLDVLATGSDSVGRFDLTGQISRNGEIRLVKQYHNAHAWLWIGMMTPFGLVGWWSDTERQLYHRFPGGLFWLWKEEWCHG